MTWDRIYTLVKQIPRGRVMTYGEIARVLGTRGGARAVGHAMAACPPGRAIPWHRVVGAGGRLLIAEPGASLQRKLLAAEGVLMTERRVSIKRHHWSGPKRAGAKKPSAKIDRSGGSRVSRYGQSLLTGSDDVR